MIKHLYDFVVIGGGIIGINIAIELKKNYRDCSICILEKEANLGEHASGRNSGVLHAGFYYDEDSVKAQFCRDGNKALTDYCKQRNISINRCGKVVVASNEEELHSLDTLLSRGKKNDVELRMISKKELSEIEPMAKTLDRAIFSPNTSTASPIELMNSIYEDAKNLGIEFHFKTKYLSKQNDILVTSNGEYNYGYVVNCAGLYADKIAKDFGVHFTLTAENYLKIGPTAIPAFWPEQYSGLKNFNLNDFFRIIHAESKLFFKSNFDFKKLAFEEYTKMSKNKLLRLASRMINFELDPKNFEWSKPGIRAQLLNTRSHSLEMDFIYEGDKKSFHVLNAVSPAWTCSIPFSKFIVKEIDRSI